MFHSRKTELEARRQQSTGYYAAALDYQFSLGSMDKGRELEHSARGGQSKGHAALPPYDSHHLAVRNRVRRGQVNRAAEIVSVDQPLNGIAKISFVNPGNELAPARNSASESPPREPSQDPVSATFARGEDHCRAHRDLPCK